MRKRPCHRHHRSPSRICRSPRPTGRRQREPTWRSSRCRMTWLRRSRKTCPIWSHSRIRRPAWPTHRCRSHPWQHRSLVRHLSTLDSRDSRDSHIYHSTGLRQRRRPYRRRRHRRHRGLIPRPERPTCHCLCCPIRRRTQPCRTLHW